MNRKTWNRGDRFIVLALALFLLAASTLVWLQNPAKIPDPQTQPGDRAPELQTQLDPNTATEDELATLPQLGRKRAKEIVDHRTRAKVMNPDAVVYHSKEDLKKVRGLGEGTIAQIEPHLRFPTTRP